MKQSLSQEMKNISTSSTKSNLLFLTNKYNYYNCLVIAEMFSTMALLKSAENVPFK